MRDRLCHLKASLDGHAGHVLWEKRPATHTECHGVGWINQSNIVLCVMGSHEESCTLCVMGWGG